MSHTHIRVSADQRYVTGYFAVASDFARRLGEGMSLTFGADSSRARD